MKPNCLLVLLAVFACFNMKAQYHDVVATSERGFNEQSAKSDHNSFTVFASKLPLTTCAMAPIVPGDKHFYESPKNAERPKWKYENLIPKRAAVSGLMLIASSIPYLIMALQTKHKGLRLCSQKTTYGSLNKASKKVTGITFSIPIGK